MIFPFYNRDSDQSVFVFCFSFFSALGHVRFSVKPLVYVVIVDGLPVRTHPYYIYSSCTGYFLYSDEIHRGCQWSLFVNGFMRHTLLQMKHLHDQRQDDQSELNTEKMIDQLFPSANHSLWVSVLVWTKRNMREDRHKKGWSNKVASSALVYWYVVKHVSDW